MWLAALLFAAVGLTAAPMYPIAAAQAYAALLGRSGTVNAAAHLFTPLTLAVPGRSARSPTALACTCERSQRQRMRKNT